MSIIPCLTWVKQGKAKSSPDKVKLNKEELKRIIEETKEKLADDEEISDDEDVISGDDDDTVPEGATAADDGSKVKANAGEEDGAMEEPEDFETKYNMDDYDDENDSNPLKGIGNLTIYASNEEDPYITLKDEDDSDNEDFEIKSTDNLIVVGRADNDMCNLEVYVYNEELSNLYVHHDILLPSFPLAVEWLDYDIAESEPGNFVAVATMEPTIDIWDLDLVDSLEPVATLGTKKKKKKKGGSHGHTDAVLDLSWNANIRNVLGSASADFTVGLWDLSEGKIVTSITQHKEKVQCLQWHPFEAQSLLSGSFDHTVKLYDCRSPDSANKSWDVGGEVERVLWNPFSPLQFLASTDTGHIFCIDSRQDKPLFTLSAHNESVTGLSLSCKIPNLLVTTSTDRTLKVWDIMNNKPSCVHKQDMKLRQLHCLASCPEAPFVFAMGGEKEMKVWDIRESSAGVAATTVSYRSGAYQEGGLEAEASTYFYPFLSRMVLKHFTGVQTSEHTDMVGSSAEAMDTQDSGVVLDTDSSSAQSQSQKKQSQNKRRKKKKNKK